MKTSIIRNKLKHIESTIINSLETHHNSDSIYFLFNKLINSLTEMDSISVLKNISVINDMLIKYDLEPKDYFFSTGLDEYFKVIEESNKNISAPSGVFFVWIGDIPQEAISYINVWKRSTNEKVDLWCDCNFLLAGKIKSIIETIYATDGIPGKTLACQDVFYSEVIDYISNENISGDQAIISFVEKRKPKLAIQLGKELKDIKTKLEQLGSCVNIKNVAKYDFLSECYYRFYLTEVLLRNNLAAASDILRLSVLYKYGGTYIDVDTLPPLDHIFSKTNLNFGKYVTSKDIVDIFKSKLFIDRVNNDKVSFEALRENNSKLYSIMEIIDDELPDSLIDDIISTSESDLYQECEIKRIDKNLISISASKNSIGDFNNNIISSHPRSKLLKIILMEMKKRYDYIFDNKFDSSNSTEASSGNNEYYNRLQNYRLDALGNNNYVTLIVSGPILLLEVILGMSYKVLDLEYDVSQVGVSFALQLPHIGIGYLEQTMYTHEHIKSSWMESEMIEEILI
ncbi:hypothetical protein LL266_17595 [Vibrio anguillarum]|uniref:TcdA/TcdB catalytic glycosyltransferase domain-containing protein n=1 Tax=Vibrio anguillarum TaxID=55601 RepID=UPI001D18F1E5|nr:TcdA/TcdB catalytic glycosyltransferase domain-containing protein [Vibrio anguillarum]MCC4238296.1 hypothetical protein [Vibrio anguillarum]